MISHLIGLMFTFILAWHLQPYNPEASTFAVVILLTALGYDAYKTTKKRK